ncbi:hypothetical protein ASPZODRAFT_128356 [Penicilliopsis zonata CBS 506.65]|uniref:Uncharacterized protein n=1 Tax=Penicilliopsis zonata CBS 506.65 TaxID=1073090 RepID=A0A1L9SRI6_9EURO|nr:hypothetical protein ASPZODRAFT_128356 [Penicilliopsis zonata CBS 506.65]OJJ49825.1 hypothetical protein ASPZODRAFT_128356 [Penicilliopsis zonata CBS 506.65]
MAASDYSHPESLGVLLAMVNQTLIETGRFFRSNGSLQSRAQLKRTLPAARDQFHDALDQLSEQIFIAKTFLERDYETIQARKATPKPTSEDVVMEEKTEERPPPETDVQPQSAHLGLSTETEGLEIKAAEEPETTDKPTEENLSDAPGLSSGNLEKAEGMPSTEGASFAAAAAGNEEISFDSMLADTTGEPNEFDLHLDFGNDEVGNQNFLAGSSFNMGAGTQDVTGMEESTNDAGDINDNNRQQGGEDHLMMHTLDGGPMNLDLPVSQGEGQGSSEDGIAPGESSFEDLFLEADGFGDDGLGEHGLLEGDGMMNVNELDDNWFT